MRRQTGLGSLPQPQSTDSLPPFISGVLDQRADSHPGISQGGPSREEASAAAEGCRSRTSGRLTLMRLMTISRQRLKWK